MFCHNLSTAKPTAQNIPRLEWTVVMSIILTICDGPSKITLVARQTGDFGLK